MNPASEDSSIVQMAAAAVARYGTLPAFTCMGAVLDFRELGRLSDDFACWLLEVRRLQPGERVGLQLPNILQYPVVALGVLKAGLVIVNINPLYTAVELIAQVRDAGVRLLVVSANTAHVAAQAVEPGGIEHVVVTGLGDLHPWPRRALINFAARHRGQGERAYRFRSSTSLRRALRQGRRAARERKVVQAPSRQEDIAVLQYTGGTTGKAKGAMLSHRNLLANMRQVVDALGVQNPEPGAIVVAPLPLYHIYAFTMNFLTGLSQGHNTLLIPNPRDIPNLIATLQRCRIRGFVGINTLYKSLVEHPALAAVDFTSLLVCSSGGMALAAHTAQRWEALTRCRILEGYGLTECAPLVSCNSARYFRTGTAGKPVLGTQVCIRSSNGSTLPAGEAGEICVRGPQVMQGYWQRPEESAAVLDVAGWLRTGDIGVLDTEGYLRIVDRIKDLIIVSGFNVYPNEIEDQVYAHPAILHAAAINAGDEYSARVRLFVVSSDPALTGAQLLSWCRARMTAYKVPREVVFCDSLPLSNVGKVLRGELRKRVNQEQVITS